MTDSQHVIPDIYIDMKMIETNYLVLSSLTLKIYYILYICF